MMPDNANGIPSPEQEQQLAAQQQEQVAQDQALLQQQSMPSPEQQAMQGEQQGQSPIQDGMNTAIDPQVLSTLAALKDNSIMDVGIVSMLANSNGIGEVIRDYSEDILKGTSAIGRILLNLMIKKNSTIEEIGDKKYGQLIKTLRKIFSDTSNLYADILLMELESDGKMEG
jgi:hypothetical protein